MDYLQEIANELGLSRLIPYLYRERNVQGAILSLDEVWLYAWQLKESGRLEEWERVFRFGMFPGIFVESFELASALLDPFWIPFGKPDLKWVPPYWDELCNFTGRIPARPPIRLTVCMLPPGEGEHVRPLELPQTALPVRFEVRPLARLSSRRRSQVRPVVGGLSIGNGPKNHGTLGGVVEDQTGQRYASTCAHVLSDGSIAEQPALWDDPRATPIGQTIAIPLQPCPDDQTYDPYGNVPHIASVDTALVKFDASIPSELRVLSSGSLCGVAQKKTMTPGQSVVFEGRTSGKRRAEIGGLALFYRLETNGITYCFRDLFEVRWRNLARSLLGSVVQPGDSGAWVCAETRKGLGWCGQIIGEDRRVGYATFAENTINAWKIEGKELLVT